MDVTTQFTPTSVIVCVITDMFSFKLYYKGKGKEVRKICYRVENSGEPQITHFISSRSLCFRDICPYKRHFIMIRVWSAIENYDLSRSPSTTPQLSNFLTNSQLRQCASQTLRNWGKVFQLVLLFSPFFTYNSFFQPLVALRKSITLKC